MSSDYCICCGGMTLWWHPMLRCWKLEKSHLHFYTSYKLGMCELAALTGKSLASNCRNYFRLYFISQEFSIISMYISLDRIKTKDSKTKILKIKSSNNFILWHGFYLHKNISEVCVFALIEQIRGNIYHLSYVLCVLFVFLCIFVK